MRCTNVTLAAFGLSHPTEIRDIIQLKRLLRENGYECSSYTPFMDYIGKPMDQFLKDHPTGGYLLGTSAHAMALIDGVLHDAASGTGRRKLETVSRVTRKTDETAPLPTFEAYRARIRVPETDDSGD